MLLGEDCSALPLGRSSVKDKIKTTRLFFALAALSAFPLRPMTGIRGCVEASPTEKRSVERTSRLISSRLNY